MLGIIIFLLFKNNDGKCSFQHTECEVDYLCWRGFVKDYHQSACMTVFLPHVTFLSEHCTLSVQLKLKVIDFQLASVPKHHVYLCCNRQPHDTRDTSTMLVLIAIALSSDKLHLITSFTNSVVKNDAEPAP